MNNQSDHQTRIRKAFVMVSLFVLLGKFAGAAKEMAVAWRYGTSAYLDAYLFVFNYVSFPVSISLSIFSVTLIPLISKYVGTEKLTKFRSEFFTFTILYSLIVWFISYFSIEYILTHSTMSQQMLTYSIEILPDMSVLIPFACVSAYFSVLMMSNEKHYNTLYESIPPLFVIFVIIIPFDIVKNPLVFGTVVGFIVHLIVLYFWGMNKPNLKPSYTIQQTEMWRQLATNIGVVMVGQILMSTLSLIDQYYLARLDAGSVSSLSYASKLCALLLGLVATAINRSTLPVFSSMKPELEKDLIFNLLIRWTGIVFFLGLFFVVAVYFFGDLLVFILFERGAFDANATKNVADIFLILALQSPMHFVYLLISTYFVSIRRYDYVAFCSLLCVMSKVFSLEFLGFNTAELVAASTVLVYLVAFIFMIFFVVRDRS
ncbi:lipid II flippase MurJ [Rheinheimera sp.]|uniref:lipid II flippase MurJ n=1 Tax=Rheinheimera sp. TaxID=1869214 RepID=UPI00307DF7AE